MAKNHKANAESVTATTCTDKPQWVGSTPDEDWYRLVMYEGGGMAEQSIEIDRAEFIHLKSCLAVRRGYSGERAA